MGSGAFLVEVCRKLGDELVESWGYPRYRADQLWTWLYRHKATTYDEMHPLPAALRADLAERTRLGALETVREVRSADGETRKYALRLPDGQVIEARQSGMGVVKRAVSAGGASGELQKFRLSVQIFGLCWGAISGISGQILVNALQ